MSKSSFGQSRRSAFLLPCSNRSHRSHRRRSPLRGGLADVFRQSRLEQLEPRWVLSVAPTLAALSDVTVAAGTTLNIALDGYDADSDDLSFTISINNVNISGGSLSYDVTEGNRSMLISTNYGDMIFELFEDLAPATTARIIELAESGFYDDLIFHRVAAYDNDTPFVIQGGDPDGDGTGGTGQTFDDEFNDYLMHTSAGVLSMAKSNDDTNDSQFFITGSSARHLDFNHSVFGFQVEGQDVRQTIEGVEVDDSDKPLTDVVMESVEIFYDRENGVLRLTAPEGAYGTADITVAVSDGHDGVATQTFQVTVASDNDDAADSPPYLGDIADVQTAADTPVSFNIPATDIEGDAVYYYAGIISNGSVYTSIDNLTVTANSSSGKVTATPSGGISGVYTLLVGVRQDSGGNWDTQLVPLVINPAAPESIDLLDVSDTGGSATDNITSLNNSAGQTMTFSVGGTVAGAVVSIFADGELIGQAMADGETTLITTDGSLQLSDGAHSFTATQTFEDVDLEVGNRSETVDLASDLSTPLSVTIDTTAPVLATIDDVSTSEGQLVDLTVVASDADRPNNQLSYSLIGNVPAGAKIDPTSGRFTWRPGELHGGGDFTITVRVADAAGGSDQQSFTVSVAEVDQPPRFETLEGLVVLTGQSVRVPVSAADADLPANPLQFSVASDAPAGLLIDPHSGLVSWDVPDEQPAGTFDLVIRATESPQGQAAGLSATATLRFTVVPASVAWQVTRRVFGAEPSLDLDSPVAREAAEALLFEAAAAQAPSGRLTTTPSGPILSNPAALGIGRGLLGFQLTADGSGGRSVIAETESEEDIEDTNLDGDNAAESAEDDLDLQGPKIHSTADSNSAESIDSSVQPPPVETARAVDAAMAAFEQSEDGDRSEDPNLPAEEQPEA